MNKLIVLLFFSWIFPLCTNAQYPVPGIVEQELTKRFPAADSIWWEYESGLYVVHFNILSGRKSVNTFDEGHTAVSFYSRGESYGKWYLTVRHFIEEKNYINLVPSEILEKIKAKIKLLDQPSIGTFNIVECAEKYYGGIHQRAYLVFAHDPLNNDSGSMRYFTFEGELIR